MVKVSIKKSTKPGKKFMATFQEEGKRDRTTHFGAAGMSDYPTHKDKARKNRYLDRHKQNENWENYKSAGSLSRYILWNKETLTASIADYKKRFKLK